MCHEHAPKLKKEYYEKKKLKQTQDVAFENGTLVPIKHDTSERIDYARIVSSQAQIFYEVDFGDGTFSNDMLPEDILVRRFLAILFVWRVKANFYLLFKGS